MQILWCLFWCIIVNSLGNSQQYSQINIGALFYEDELDIEKTFEATVERINSENEGIFKLFPLIRRLSPVDSSIALEKEACDLIDNGVAAIFGPSSKADSDIVSLICNSTGIPHILFDALSEEHQLQKQNHQLTINVYPAQLILSKAYADIVQNFGWRKFTVVYDEEDVSAPTRLQDLLQLRDLHNDVVRVRKFKRNDDYRIIWKSIKGERRIVLDCSPDILVEVLNASIPFDLTGQYNNLFLTNLETHSCNLEDLKDNVTFAVNATAARLGMNGKIYDLNVWERSSLYRSDNNNYNTPLRTLLPDLIYDAVTLYGLALRNISTMYQINPPRVRCEYDNYNKGQTWAMGRFINRVMKTIAPLNDEHFRSSLMQFDEDGQRINFKIEIYEPLENYGVAFWDTKGQITPQHVQANVTKKFIYRVATRIGEPYFMENQTAIEANITGNGRYMGYAVDLIDALAKENGFEYVFVPVADNAYGKYNKETKQWNGIIGELINNDAHMGICDLTITQARKTVVDFTVPFMQLGISILSYQKPFEQKEWSAFLEPFTKDVWIYVMISVFIIAFLFIFMARISKDEWENPHPCNQDPDALENKWNILNSFWLTIGSIMTAGSDILPRSAPMRTFNAMWWIFAVIITNSYTANLAAFLTNSKMEGSITGIEDLAGQTAVKFGTIEGGSTYTFFSESNETTYRLAYNMMQHYDPSAYTKDNIEGVERVLKNNGSYMFLMETTSLEYNTERNCKLKMLGEKFGEKHYAIAVPFGAEYRSNLSVAILRLGERGELFKLKNKWWKNHNNTCDAEVQSDSETPDMTFSEVRGIFYTLGVGVLVAYIAGIVEFLLYTHKVALEEKMTFKEAFIKEFKFVLCVWNNKKPINVTPTNSTRSSSRLSGNTIKSGKSGKSSKSLKSNSRKNTPPAEMLERKSLKSLKSAIVNLVEGKM
ncbi:glutamate receptor ionotropic, kainate 2 [Lucilia cuprina]|uniref:glutamate receptor ionotropic, kainate 2 n=1 Tax=Lucilia cuprina TaxID=7375 RepID=UPI001F063E70|nr:glutamate receptor ionotropic, kainate 2 [Lucilia cuprina]